MATQEQIESFCRFAAEQLQQGEHTLSMSDLFDLWETQNLKSAEHDENIAAIRASLNDLLAGESGRDAAEIIRELRVKFDSDQDWQQAFAKLLEMVEPGNPDVDDSRESIYPVR